MVIAPILALVSLMVRVLLTAGVLSLMLIPAEPSTFSRVRLAKLSQLANVTVG